MGDAAGLGFAPRQLYWGHVTADYLHLLQDAPVGRTCTFNRREYDWSFDFEGELGMSVSVPWRIVVAQRIALTDADNGQLFGLSAPLDAEQRANELVRGQRVISFDVHVRSADIRVTFDGDAVLELFNNSSAHEGWKATFFDGQKTITVVGCGGGDVAFF